MRKENKVPLLG